MDGTRKNNGTTRKRKRERERERERVRERGAARGGSKAKIIKP